MQVVDNSGLKSEVTLEIGQKDKINEEITLRNEAIHRLGSIIRLHITGHLSDLVWHKGMVISEGLLFKTLCHILYLHD